MTKINSYYLKRRKNFLGKLPDNSIVVIPNKPISIRSNDVAYKFRPDSDFFYLTGFDEPNSICLFKKERRSSFYYLFIEGADREKEIWIGKKASLQSAKKIYGADKTFLTSDFENIFKKLIQGVEYIHFPFGISKTMDSIITEAFAEARKSIRSGVKIPKAINDPRDIIHKMRLVKDSYEISCILNAANISKSAHILVMASSKAGMYEYELEGLIEYHFRMLGSNGPAYPSIVGSGTNSTILHYSENSRKIKKNDLILIDAGCEFKNYASDLTRTYPENKKFNTVQKDLYQIVLEAQIKAIEKVKPGEKFLDSYNKAVHVIVEGLKGLKLLRGSTSEIIKKRKYKKFFMHRIGHWLGLDVHDAGPYIDEKGNSIKLVPNMVMTVEPGVYIPDYVTDVPKEFLGLGIRIEDDVLVTKTSNRVITSDVPKFIHEIEAFSC